MGVSAEGPADAPVLIAGGGIGGLAAAIALAERGMASRVLEAEPTFSEQGAGVQIGPNGSRILRAWGLGEALEQTAGKPERIVIRDGLSGRILAQVPLGRFAEERYGAPYFVTERRLLHRLLLDKASESGMIELVNGFRLLGMRRQSNNIAAISERGEEISGRALIAADGVHSRIRSMLFGVAPRFSGRNAWRATAPPEIGNAQGAERDVNLWLGPNAHLVHYCCGPDGPLNVVGISTGKPASPGWGTKGDAQSLKRLFSGWAPEARRILERFGDWMIWPLLDMPPLRRWSEGRVTLLGDAAHPLMPFLASGAVMAIEDAAVLGKALANAPGDPQAGFRLYEALRRPRTGRVQRASLRMGEIYHMTGPMRLARNLTLVAMPQSRLIARNDWLYGYCAED